MHPVGHVEPQGMACLTSITLIKRDCWLSLSQSPLLRKLSTAPEVALGYVGSFWAELRLWTLTPTPHSPIMALTMSRSSCGGLESAPFGCSAGISNADQRIDTDLQSV